MRTPLIPILAILHASRAMAQTPPPPPAPPTAVQPAVQPSAEPPGPPLPPATAQTPRTQTPPQGVTPPAPSPGPAPAQAPVPPAPGASTGGYGYPYPYPYPSYAPYPGAGQSGAGYPTYPGAIQAPPIDPRPRFLPYQAGQPAPPGYRYEQSVRQGPIVAGAITAGVPYLLGLLVSSSEHFTNKRGFLVIPAIGPWLTLLTRDSTCDTDLPISDCTEDFSSRFVLTLDGLLQTGGAILVASGFLNPKRRYTLDQWGALSVSPRVYRGGAGLGASGSF